MFTSEIVWPIFPIRRHYSLSKVDEVKLVSTYTNDYVLDDTSLPGNYMERRKQIKDRGDKLYGLYKVYTSLESVILSSDTLFIDNSGKLITKPKLKLRNRRNVKILRVDVVEPFTYRIFLAGFKNPILYKTTQDMLSMQYARVADLSTGTVIVKLFMGNPDESSSD